MISLCSSVLLLVQQQRGGATSSIMHNNNISNSCSNSNNCWCSNNSNSYRHRIEHWHNNSSHAEGKVRRYSSIGIDRAMDSTERPPPWALHR